MNLFSDVRVCAVKFASLHRLATFRSFGCAQSLTCDDFSRNVYGCSIFGAREEHACGVYVSRLWCHTAARRLGGACSTTRRLRRRVQMVSMVGLVFEIL